MNKNLRLVSLVALASLGLASCGQKGPLYLPSGKDTPPTHRTVPPPNGGNPTVPSATVPGQVPATKP